MGKSGVARQIDVWVTGSVAGCEIQVAIECKFHNDKVDINLIDSFIGMLQDIGAHKGVFITTTGFTSGAEGRAKAADISLKIMSLEDAMETDWAEYLGDRLPNPDGLLGQHQLGIFRRRPTDGLMRFLRTISY